MILVKLKMKPIYKLLLTILGLLIVVGIAIGVLYMSKDKFLNNNSDIEVNGSLSINYENSKYVNVDNNSVIDFSITNSGENISYFAIGFKKVRGEGKYKLIQGDDVISEDNLSTTDEYYTEYLSVKNNSTEKYKLEIDTEEGISFTLDFRYKENSTKSFVDLLLSNNKINNSTTTKVGIENAITNEGLIKSTDDDGSTYYFRGDIQNNYVSYGDKIWRIVRINGDESIRIVLDDAVLSRYYTEDNKVFDYEKSNMYSFLNSWLIENELDSEKIVSTKYCNDITFDDNHVYNAYTRILVNNIPTFNCLGNIVNSKIGLMTIDEVVYAGINNKDKNEKYYLYNPNITNTWYTLTGLSGNDSYINMFMINSDGTVNKDINGNLYRNVRPVINLSKSVEVSGAGTKEDPYIIK